MTFYHQLFRKMDDCYFYTINIIIVWIIITISILVSVIGIMIKNIYKKVCDIENDIKYISKVSFKYD